MCEVDPGGDEIVDQSSYTLEARILALAWWHESGKTKHDMKVVRERFNEKFNEVAPRGEKIREWEDKLFLTGSILDKKRSGRPKERSSIEKVADIQQSIRQSPTKSIRSRASELGMTKSTLHNAMKKDLNFKAFRPTSVQFLSPEDKLNRVDACRKILESVPSKRDRDCTFFSDECAIYADGKRRFSFFWSKENPHYFDQIKQYPPQIMIWCAVSASHLIGPFVCNGRITAASYCEMLETKFIPALRKTRIRKPFFQQDGAPGHTALVTREFLNRTFPDHWIGKFGPVPWPPRSPDLTTPDNAVWGILKKNIIGLEIASVAELTEIAEDFLTEMNEDKELLQKMSDRTWRRIELAIRVNGDQVDPYDK